MGIFDNRRVAASVRTDEDFLVALESAADVIFLQNSNIMNLDDQIRAAHSKNKIVFVHMDFAEGIGKDRAGLNFVKLKGADGILSTRSGLIKYAREIGLETVQRFFIVDSHSVDTAIESIKIAKPDIVEIMPGVLEKKIIEFANKATTPILAGGLIEYESEVDAALDAGATAVSTGQRKLWNYR